MEAESDRLINCGTLRKGKAKRALDLIGGVFRESNGDSDTLERCRALLEHDLCEAWIEIHPLERFINMTDPNKVRASLRSVLVYERKGGSRVVRLDVPAYDAENLASLLESKGVSESSER
jgi:hypothetical protein